MPWWVSALVLIAASLFFEFHGRSFVQRQWNSDKVVQTQLAKIKQEQRDAENSQLKTQQTTISSTIQKVHDDEISRLTTALNDSRRLRIGSQFCGATSGQTDTQSATSGAAADTGGRVLSEEMDRAVKQLIFESEQVAATGRAAQAFIRENGLGE
ncbi:hypothetical protein S2091_2192 [Solimicrobium silvestre]|uniref:Uncharacterized protein n=2 Tax=Solimicrobium silvestre TaxID=2099400 RepID=A0A2S9GZR0_9BURK|nr:hypothetical protein S2091_2192 [Solimicrobium silvestre]